MKKTMIALLSVFILFSAVGCSAIEGVSSNTESGESKEENAKVKEYYKILKRLSKKKVGDTIEFGTYRIEYDDETSYKPMVWDVILKDEANECMLVMADLVYDAVPYIDWDIEYTTDVDYPYKDSYVRKYLNDEFYNNAFSDVEKMIIMSTVYKDDFGNELEDYLLAPSSDEIYKAREAKFDTEGDPTSYAEEKISCAEFFYIEKNGGTVVWNDPWKPSTLTRCAYWLRENEYYTHPLGMTYLLAYIDRPRLKGKVTNKNAKREETIKTIEIYNGIEEYYPFEGLKPVMWIIYAVPDDYVPTFD